MLPEVLLTLACVSGKGCKDTYDQYYKTNPELRQIVENGEKTLKRYQETVVQVVGPHAVELESLVYFSVIGATTVNLNRNWSVKLNSSENMILYKKEF